MQKCNNLKDFGEIIDVVQKIMFVKRSNGKFQIIIY